VTTGEGSDRVIGIYVILAAGAGTRMGGPKALVEVEGETLLSHHIHAAQIARLGGPVCVTGADADLVEGTHAQFPVRFVRNPDPASPMIDSIRIGLRGVPRGNVAYVTPVDVLPPRLDTFDLLAEALETHPSGRWCVRPVMRGRPGHPVILLPEAVEAILADPSIDRLDAWVRDAEAAGRVQSVEVDDYNVLSNLNRPEDLPPGGVR
jgi:CTP:molybdopterin cytidylyltransferase MocA